VAALLHNALCNAINRQGMTTSTIDIVRAMVAAWNARDAERIIDLADGLTEASAPSEDILLLLGLAQQSTNRPSQAVTSFKQLTRLQPGVSAYWNNLGIASRQAGDLPASEQALTTALTLAAQDPEVMYNLGLVYIQQRRWLLARETLLNAVGLAPDFVEARLQAAHACHVCGDNTTQQDMLTGAIDWPGQPAEQALILASMLSVQGDLNAALRTLAQAQLPPEPDAGLMRLRIAAQRVALYERSNQLAQAQHEILVLPLDALDALPPDARQARIDGWRAHAALAMRRGDFAEAAALYQRTLDLATDDETRAGASFGLASAYDKQRRHAEAWRALLVAHAAQVNIAREVAPELLAADSKPLPIAGHTVSQLDYAGWKPATAPGNRQSPVFVVGFPRSGTTLLEQMLDAHSDFVSMDERAFLHELIERMSLVGQRYPEDLANLSQAEVDQLRAVYFKMVGSVLPGLGHRRLVDKNPLNMLCLPMIMRLFPESRIILCVRHPCDVLLSCMMQPFRSPAFMVLCSSLQRLAQGYTRAFEHWYDQVEVFAPHVLEWRYESVIRHFDDEVARLGRFLEVENVASMTRFAEHARNKQFISTPSYAQVTEGLYAKAVGRWEAYRDQFQPVLPALQPWIDRLGYHT
ncbi:MAG: sulfotransferase, partial [Rhodanobacter sp.]